MKNIIRWAQAGLIYITVMTSYSINLLANQQLQELTASLQNLSNVIPIEQNNNEKFGFTNTVVSINQIVEMFNEKTDCNAKPWSDKLENICKCCLIKNAPALDDGKKPSEVLQICLDKKQCDNSIIQELLNHEKIEIEGQEEKLRELISDIYNKSVIVKEIFPHDIKFNSDGTLNEEMVKQLLVQAHQSKKLNDPNFSNVSCLNIKDIMSQKGFSTEQLFSIVSNCLGKKNDYILKGVDRREIINLQKTSLIPGLDTYIYPKNVSGFPSFILPFAYISYNYKNKDHYLSLMLKAPGYQMSSFAKKYKEQIISKSEVVDEYYQTGFSLSQFHQKFMKDFKHLAKPGQLLNLTYIQGDAHQDNIFYDKATNEAIFIDNEKFSSPENPFEDIEMFTFRSLLFLPGALIIEKNFFDQWFFLSISSFLKGYIDAYKIDERPNILEELIFNFRNGSSYCQKNPWCTYFDDYKHYEYIFDKIFEELIKLYS